MPSTRVLLFVAVLVSGLAAASAGLCQEQPPVMPAVPLPQPPADAPSLQPGPPAQPALPPPVFGPDPPGGAAPTYGWFAAAEADAVLPEISHRLMAPVVIAGNPVSVNLGTTGFDWTPAARVEF